MSDYINLFNRLVETQIVNIGKDTPPFFSVNSSTFVDTKIIEQYVIDFYNYKNLELEDIVGKCFRNTLEFSLFLIDLGIKNVITIGDVKINNNCYFGCTKESILKDMDDGYIHNEVANAHAWITLENGLIVDFSIIPSSENNSFQKRYMRKEKCIYFSDRKYRNKRIEHVPYFLGDEYIYMVVMGNSDYQIKYAQSCAIKIRRSIHSS